MDLFLSFSKILKKKLINKGFDVANISNEEILLSYLNYYSKTPNINKRSVLLSKEFYCPENLQNGLKNIKEIIENGDSLMPYMSKNINSMNYQDNMLNHWKIYHFHLGDSINNGFATRTKKLLFVYFDSENAYFINIFDHNSWYDTDIIEIIDNNWSHIIDKYKLSSVGVGNKTTSNEVEICRKSNIAMAITLENGNRYTPLNLSVVASGHNFNVLRQYDSIQFYFSNLEKYIRDKFNILNNENLEFKVESRDKDFNYNFYNNLYVAKSNCEECLCKIERLEDILNILEGLF